MRNDEWASDRKMLSQFPVGTPMDETIHFANHKKGWSDVSIYYKHGYTAYRGEEVGEKSIRVHLGQFRIMTTLYFVTHVSVDFGFNENSELIDIQINRTVDAL